MGKMDVFRDCSVTAA